MSPYAELSADHLTLTVSLPQTGGPRQTASLLQGRKTAAGKLLHTYIRHGIFV